MEQKKIELKLNINLRRLLVWFLILFLFVPYIVNFLLGSSGIMTELPLSSAIAEIKQGKVESVEIKGDELLLVYPKDEQGKQVMGMSRKEEGASFMEELQRAGVDESKVKIIVTSQDFSKAFWNVLSIVLPIIGFGALMFFLMKRQGGANDVFGIGKSKAKMFFKGKQSIKFKDVAGVDEAKKELEEVVDFLKNPKKYYDL